MSEFDASLEQLNDRLITQARRVYALVLDAVESFFECNEEQARDVVRRDAEVDREDVEIERASVPLLAMGVTDPYVIRSILVVVKANNEIERIADLGVNIAEAVVTRDVDAEKVAGIPGVFRVMANSVVGMYRESGTSLRTRNPELARKVLLYDDTVDRFKREILKDAQVRLARGEVTPEFAFQLLSVTKALERIADHATNIAEQVIYLETGRTVRHDPEGWSEPFEPDADPS